MPYWILWKEDAKCGGPVVLLICDLSKILRDQNKTTLESLRRPVTTCQSNRNRSSLQLSSSRRHIGTVTISFAISSTIRDIPVPEELVIKACLELLVGHNLRCV